MGKGKKEILDKPGRSIFGLIKKRKREVKPEWREGSGHEALPPI